MKPFNLELAKAGHPVCTRDGRPVKILDFEFRHSEYPIVAKMCNKDYDTLQTYTKEGFFIGSTKTSEYNLCMASVKKEGWINIYKLPDGSNAGSSIFSSKKEAEKSSYNQGYITTVKIEWEE